MCIRLSQYGGRIVAYVTVIIEQIKKKRFRHYINNFGDIISDSARVQKLNVLIVPYKT